MLLYHWLLPFHPLCSREFPPRRFRASQNESGSVPLQIHRKCRNWETNSPRPLGPQLCSAPGRKRGMVTPTQLRTPCLSLRRWRRVCQGTPHLLDPFRGADTGVRLLLRQAEGLEATFPHHLIAFIIIIQTPFWIVEPGQRSMSGWR